MKIIYILLLLKTFTSALVFDNPHEIDSTGRDINDDDCKTCHLSFNGGYSGYFASIYKPTMQEYSIYLASLNNFYIDNLKTATLFQSNILKEILD
jgi:hypothetical protein